MPSPGELIGDVVAKTPDWRGAINESALKDLIRTGGERNLAKAKSRAKK